ncbi:calmodulin protein [Trifolium repens]|nr:calmodulin protein [Trifolium repens]
MNPSLSESIALNAFTASTSPIPLSKAFAAALYSSRLILPSLLVSNFSKTHFISSFLGWKLISALDVCVCLELKLFFWAIFFRGEFGLPEKLPLNFRKLNFDIIF